MEKFTSYMEKQKMEEMFMNIMEISINIILKDYKRFLQKMQKKFIQKTIMKLEILLLIVKLQYLHMENQKKDIQMVNMLIKRNLPMEK